MGRGNKSRRGGKGGRGRGGSSKFNSGKSFKKREISANDDFNVKKRFKRDEPPPVQDNPSFSESSSEDEAPDPYKQLLSTFAVVTQQSRHLAALSDESDDDSEEEEEKESKANESDVKSSDDDSGDPKTSKAKKDNNDSKSEGEDEENSTSETEDPEKEPVEEDEEDNEEINKEQLGTSDDPFTKHIQWELSPELLKTMSSDDLLVETQTISWPVLGRMAVQIPQEATSTVQNVTSKFSIQEKQEFAPLGTIPIRIHTLDWDKLYIKQQIQDHIKKANSINVKDTDEYPLTPLQCELFSILNNYQDLYYAENTYKNSEEVRFAYCLHAVNHVLKTRIKVLHHNARLNKKLEVPDEYRDQQLVRPKVLILLPFKESALRTVNMLATILLGSTKGVVMNLKRFNEEFGGEELHMPRRNPKPEDYEQIFAGSTDDTFRIGLTVTKKCLKLYADFYDSDIIIASPLGLRMIVGAEGEEGRDYDFLASIELLIADQADIFLQQNWDHLLHLWQHLHLQPRETHGADFSRLRPWALAGHAKYYRQTVLLSSVQLPELSALFNRKCHNYAGSVRVANPITVGSICHVVVHLPQVFHRIEASSPAAALDLRFETFTTKILPQYKESLMSHTLVFAPSYFDYVRLRNYFKREDISFVQACEYSKEGKIARARDMFFHNDAHFLLYSERFHFFRRMRIKGIRHILFYQPPTYPHFYSEMCNFMQEVNQNPREGGGTDTNMSVTVLYSKYDAQRVAGIVGSDRTAKMLASDRKVHMMVTGD